MIPIQELEALRYLAHLASGYYAPKDFAEGELNAHKYGQKIYPMGNDLVNEIYTLRKIVNLAKFALGILSTYEEALSTGMGDMHLANVDWKNEFVRALRSWEGPESKMHNTIIRVVEVDNKIVKVVIPARGEETVDFYLSSFPKSLRGEIKPGARFFALMNIGTMLDKNLYFEEIELAEKPDDEDGLA
jgi:hypothetical protein